MLTLNLLLDDIGEERVSCAARPSDRDHRSSALPPLFTPAQPLRDTSATFVQSGARLISAPFWRRNLATSRFRLEQATSSAVLPPAIVLGETPFAIRAFASGNLPSAAANIRKLAP